LRRLSGRRPAVTILALALALVLFAATPASAVEPAARLQEDALGREVAVPADPRRVVALAPNLVEILYALGEGDRLVGRTENALHPAGAADLPSVGGMARPSLEAVLALRPDLVLATTEGNHPGIVRRLEAMGLPVVTVDRDSTGIEGVWEAVLQTGQAVGAAGAARALVAKGRERIEATLRGLPDDCTAPPRVLLLVWAKPAVAAGPRTYLNDLLEAAGAVNAASGLEADWPQLGREGIVALRPDLILVADSMSGGPPPGLEALRTLPGLDARVERVSGDPLLRPSPAALDGLPALVRAIHGEP